MVKKLIQFKEGIKITGVVTRVVYRCPDSEWNNTRRKFGYRNATSFKLQMHGKEYQDYKVTDIEAPVDIKIEKGKTLPLAKVMEYRKACEHAAQRTNRKDVPNIVNSFFQANMEDHEGHIFSVNFGAMKGEMKEPVQLAEEIEEFVTNLEDWQIWVDEEKEEEY